MKYMIAGTNSQDETIEATTKILPVKLMGVLILLVIIIYLALPSITQWYSSIPNIDGNTLTTSVVIRGELIRDVAVSGKAVAAKAPQLYSTEVGKITLLVKPGEAVNQNQIVAQLDSPELNSLIKQQ